MENSLNKSESSILMDKGEDVLWVLSCLIMAGMANALVMQKEDYILH
jgi:hypothetical protein